MYLVEFIIKTICVLCLVSESCLTLCDPWTISNWVSLAMWILQAWILECVAMPSSRGAPWPRDWTQVSPTAAWFFTVWATRKTQNYLVLHFVCWEFMTTNSISLLVIAVFKFSVCSWFCLNSLHVFKNLSVFFQVVQFVHVLLFIIICHHPLYFFFFCCFVLFYFFNLWWVLSYIETAMGLHVFPIPIPPPTSLSTRSL